MGNHYHLLLETPEGNLSQIMRHINGAYTTYFNAKRKRSGHLFQGRYKAILVEADAYAAELSRYIHLNPVKAGVVKMPEEYVWSSYRSYIRLATSPRWLHTGFIFGYFSEKDSAGAYRKFVAEGLIQDIESPMEKVIAATILGRPEFVSEVSRQHLAGKQPERNLPALKRLNRPTLDEIITGIEQALPDQSVRARNICLYFCHRYSGARLREIGEQFGLSDAAVSQASRRVRVASERDREIRGMLEEIAGKLGL